MSKQVERRADIIDAIAAHTYGERSREQALKRAAPYVDRLLAYFDEHEPKVALAIREGIPDSVPDDVIRYGLIEADQTHLYGTETWLIGNAETDD